MKVMGFVGSPRKGGNTDVLVSEVLRGAVEAGATVEKVYLNDLDARGCQACDTCRSGEGYTGCILDDDMPAVHKRLVEADAFVLGCPIYCFGPSAQAKIFLDRWYGLGYRENGERKSMLRGKRMVLCLVYGDDNPFTSGAINAFGTFRDEAEWCGVEMTSVLYGTASKPGEIKQNAAIMQEAYDVGRRLGGG
jgi:multimeric flavodoxin WrbA